MHHALGLGRGQAIELAGVAVRRQDMHPGADGPINDWPQQTRCHLIVPLEGCHQDTGNARQGRKKVRVRRRHQTIPCDGWEDAWRPRARGLGWLAARWPGTATSYQGNALHGVRAWHLAPHLPKACWNKPVGGPSMPTDSGWPAPMVGVAMPKGIPHLPAVVRRSHGRGCSRVADPPIIVPPCQSVLSRRRANLPFTTDCPLALPSACPFGHRICMRHVISCDVSSSYLTS